MNAETEKLLRDFRRHFHKVEDVYSALAMKGSFSLSIEYRDDRIIARNETPNAEETVRFVVLMRRFLSPTDPLYYRNLWQTFKPNLGPDFPQDQMESLEKRIQWLEQGTLPITVNGENLTAEKIYETLSSAEYFDNDATAQKYLEQLGGAPLVDPLLWYSFYDYTLTGFALMSALFQVLKDAGHIGTVSDSQLGTIAERNQCIYCLATDGRTFTSEEHIFAESLGNDKLVLPQGCVCDTCNSGVLSGLDNTLLEFEPIAMMRVLFVPYTKQGRLPKANFQNMTMKKTAPRHIQITAKNKTGRAKNIRQVDDEWTAFTLEWRGRKKFNPRLLGRALYKVALGMVALAQGQEVACSSKYNVARQFITKDEGTPNNLLMRMKAEPHPAVHVAQDSRLPGTAFAIDIFGLMFMLNLEPDPALQLTEELRASHFALYSLDAHSPT